MKVVITQIRKPGEDSTSFVVLLWFVWMSSNLRTTARSQRHRTCFISYTHQRTWLVSKNKNKQMSMQTNEWGKHPEEARHSSLGNEIIVETTVFGAAHPPSLLSWLSHFLRGISSFSVVPDRWDGTQVPYSLWPRERTPSIRCPFSVILNLSRRTQRLKESSSRSVPQRPQPDHSCCELIVAVFGHIKLPSWYLIFSILST